MTVERVSERKRNRKKRNKTPSPPQTTNTPSTHHVAEYGGDDAEGEGDDELHKTQANVHHQEQVQEILKETMKR